MGKWLQVLVINRVGLESNESNYVQKSIANLQVQTERIELRAKIHIWLTFGDVRPMGSNPWVEPWDKSGLRPQKSVNFVAFGRKFRLQIEKLSVAVCQIKKTKNQDFDMPICQGFRS